MVNKKLVVEEVDFFLKGIRAPCRYWGWLTDGGGGGGGGGDYKLCIKVNNVSY